MEPLEFISFVLFFLTLGNSIVLNEAGYIPRGSNVVQMSQDPPDEDTNFLALGDWGGLPYSPFFTMIQKSIASRIGDLAAQNKYQFVLGLGDNFYYDGVESVHDLRFKETYEDVFRAESLEIPWYMIAGNHDHHTNVSAQIAYTNLSRRWHFPHYNYTFTVPVSGSGPAGVTARFVMLDTVVLCGRSDVDYLGQQPQGAEDRGWANSMLQWSAKVISESRDDYLFVCGHYPVYSIGHHGSTECLLEMLQPLLHRYRVTAYLNGHDHNLQHIRYTDNTYRRTVDYLTVGAGNFISTSTAHRHDIPKHSLRFHWADFMAFGGFADIRLRRQSGTVNFYRANGTVLYRYGFEPRSFDGESSSNNNL